MKNKLFSLMFLLTGLTMMYGQVIPKGMNYQAVARTLKGEILSNQNIQLQILLFSNDQNKRTEFFTEVHDVHTGDLGLFNLVVGEGKRSAGHYGLVPWNTENIWMEVSIKNPGMPGFAVLSNSKLQSVPYAIHAGTANKIITKTDTKTSNFAPPEPGVVSTNWSVFGNAKTNESGNPYRENSLGTTDAVDLILITDNKERMRILANGNIVTKLNFEIGKNLTVGQNFNIIGNATLGDSLVVSKNVQLNTTGGETVNFGPLTIDKMSPVWMSGTLTVDKSADLNSTMTVQGQTDLNSRLYVNQGKPTLLTGTLQVDSVTFINDSLKVTNISPVDLSGTLRVDSCATFKEKIKITSLFNTDTSGSAPSGSLQVNGGFYLGENLVVGGIAKFGGPALFKSPVSISDMTPSTTIGTGALTVSGGVGIGLNLNVGGMTTTRGMMLVKDLTSSTNPLTGALKVNGGVGIRKMMHVSGATSLDTLTVANRTTLNSGLTVNSDKPFVADFINTLDRHGISIQINNSTPNRNNNFVEFRNSISGVVGRIEGENVFEYTNNQRYINELKAFDSYIELGEIGVATATISLAAALAGVAAATSSVTACAGVIFAGPIPLPAFCATLPINSLIVAAGFDVVAKSLVLAANVTGLVQIKGRKEEYVNYKATHFGVSYESGAGDYAEWLPKEDTAEQFLPGYIVGIKNGKISRNITGAQKIMVISTQPIILGNGPKEHEKNLYEKVAFMGQVPVHVLGKVLVGDFIIASGNHDGMGKAISPADIQLEDYANLLGTAWSASADDIHSMVNVAIGLNDGEIRRELTKQQVQLDLLKTELDKSDELLGTLVPGYISRSENDSPLNRAHLQSTRTGQNLAEVSEQQINDLLAKTESLVLTNGGAIEGVPFWDKLKQDPVFKALFVKKLQTVYKQEYTAQVEKLNPANLHKK